MKKLTAIAIILISMLLTSCSNSTVVPENIDDLIACFGQDKIEILKMMNLTEEEARDTSEPFSNDPFIFPLKKRQKILGNEMIALILISDDEKTVHGMKYTQTYTDAEYAFKLAKKIDKQLASGYKDDSTFAGRSISDVPSLETFTEMSQGYGSEWIYKDDINIGLNVAVKLSPEPDTKSTTIIELYFYQIDREKYIPKIS